MRSAVKGKNASTLKRLAAVNYRFSYVAAISSRAYCTYLFPTNHPAKLIIFGKPKKPRQVTTKHTGFAG